MSDCAGLFGGISQALKENTVTFDYNVAPGILMRYEWRRDYSNQPFFLTDVQGVLTKRSGQGDSGDHLVVGAVRKVLGEEVTLWRM